MQISANLAYQIIYNLKDIILQDLNFMNDNGYIIASTDPNRVNTFHQAAKACVDTKNTIVIEHDDQYKGAKKGINIPVFFDSEIVGVIGITGEASEVEKYGTIIKKMTEILIKEDWLNKTKIGKRDNYRNTIEGILNSRDEFLNTISKQYNIENSFFAVSHPHINFSDNKDIDAVLDVLDSYFYDMNDIIYSFVNQNLVILFLNKTPDFIKMILKNINTSSKNLHGIDLCFGISSTFSDLSSAMRYYNEAVNAFEWNLQNDGENFYSFYDDMGIGLLLIDIKETTKEVFLNKVLKNIPEKDFEFYRNLIYLYGKYNGSINKLSEEFFMHKNTIQYRLNNIFKLTGYNPRNINDFIILKIAFMLSQNP